MPLLLLGCAHPPVAPVGPVVPAAEVMPLDEGALADLLRNERGDALLVVNFWATWCVPCVREMDVFARASAAHPGTRFALVSVDDVRDAARVAPFLAEQAVALPAFHLRVDDAGSVLARRVPDWPDLIPVTLVVEPGGGIRRAFHGEIDGDALSAALP